MQSRRLTHALHDFTGVRFKSAYCKTVSAVMRDTNVEWLPKVQTPHTHAQRNREKWKVSGAAQRPGAYSGPHPWSISALLWNRARIEEEARSERKEEEPQCATATVSVPPYYRLRAMRNVICCFSSTPLAVCSLQIRPAAVLLLRL